MCVCGVACFADDVFDFFSEVFPVCFVVVCEGVSFLRGSDVIICVYCCEYW